MDSSVTTTSDAAGDVPATASLTPTHKDPNTKSFKIRSPAHCLESFIFLFIQRSHFDAIFRLRLRRGFLLHHICTRMHILKTKQTPPPLLNLKNKNYVKFMGIHTNFTNHHMGWNQNYTEKQRKQEMVARSTHFHRLKCIYIQIRVN